MSEKVTVEKIGCGVAFGIGLCVFAAFVVWVAWNLITAPAPTTYFQTNPYAPR